MSVTFAVTRDDIITHALQELGVLGEGDSASTTQLTESAWWLNGLVKAWAADGMPLWNMLEAYVLPTTGTAFLTIGSSTQNIVTSYNNTTTTTSSVQGAATITVASTAGATGVPAVGIELSDGTMQWTTMSSKIGSTIALNNGLTNSVASGANVFLYQTSNLITRPLRIVAAYNYNIAGQESFPINIITKDQYLSLGNKNSQGVTTQIYYDPLLTNGLLYVYPQFLTGNYYIQITYQKEFDDFNSGTDNPNFPQEYDIALTLALASLLGPKYGLDKDRQMDMMEQAKEFKEMALSMGNEEGSLLIQPDWRGQFAAK